MKLCPCPLISEVLQELLEIMYRRGCIGTHRAKCITACTKGDELWLSTVCWAGRRLQVLKRPNVVGNIRFHSGCHAKALVYPAEIVIREVQSASGFVIARKSMSYEFHGI